MGFTYDPQVQLAKLFPSESSLDNIDDVLSYIQKHKQQSALDIQKETANYQHPINPQDDIHTLTSTFGEIRDKSADTQAKILAMTSSIQRLDIVKKNLVLSMKVLKRLQMLVNAYNSLNEVVNTRDYKQIATYLGVVRELLVFFKPYRSIDQIGLLNQHIHKTQNKLVDDVFIDFEDSFTNNFSSENLIYGCEILQLIDEKYKDKLLQWFYNLQLKEIRSIFSSTEEAGNLDNLNRRYIFFRNVLSNIQTNYLSVFPKSWNVDYELAKLFCEMTNSDLKAQLTNVASSEVLLDSLTKTLELEKFLNETFKTNHFEKIISIVFEPYLTTWVNEQDGVLSAKFMEFYSAPKIPQELISPQTAEDILTVLRVNNVPNFANSSSELFKLFQKLLVQIIKLSNGKILLDLARLDLKYLREYNYKVLVPVLHQSESNPKGLEPVKYLTMILNTADYVNNNINDLQDKFVKLIDEKYKDRIDFEPAKNLFFDVIGKSIQGLVSKVSHDLQFTWRQFENNGWEAMESVSDTSNYMEDFINTMKEDNRVILTLIIRDSYVRSYCDKLVEMVVHTFVNKLKIIKPLSIVNVEQILVDVAVLKNYMATLPLYSDPNYDDTKQGEESKQAPKAYIRYLDSQFGKLTTLLKLLLTPVLPVDNMIENYFNLVGDKSLPSFTKFLNLKNISKADQPKYIENFKLQLTIPNSLAEDSHILSILEEDSEEEQQSSKHPSSQGSPQQFDIKELISSRSPEPHLPDIFKTNPTKLKINNPLKDFSINGEQHVSKFNENFRNIGKFFRKDNNNDYH
ncbi:hypothetical protein FT663_02408 [Candidozyma haemuli var. vulneris]|uniref:Vps53 N-terminal domain-containing protein n=1 Tax=Candidozyma haemuli TaxID=45357 RepID=A0A2V1B1N2_9ASCO|nr:hypothetical protein CXQ85_002920 [[Candida] haemuloni]KAF3985578.1 hypothetical protein FT662_05070 [[Candida] haemuloni var. vulneris]KAF3992218.1 hypothetical protein FT663_02408 [[Candida] haemuloni var. vulneris]PVH23191.1 hypothetical protein CXQ85_002920 [[Candida] haemuloni]